LPLSSLFRPRRSHSPADLAAFLHAQAAYVAQKTVLDYCRVKTGRAEKQYFTDPDFLAALQHCRWQVFFAALTDVTALLEAHLRPHTTGPGLMLAQQLAALHQTALGAEAPPRNEAAAAAEASDGVLRHLLALQDQAPYEAHRLPLLAEPILFATLPIHAEQRAGESLAIKGALRFQMVTTQQELERRFDAGKLAVAVIEAMQPDA